MAVLGQKSVARLWRKRFLCNDPVAGPGVGQYQMYPHKPPAVQEIDRELVAQQTPASVLVKLEHPGDFRPDIG